jgi:hypothetical protein
MTGNADHGPQAHVPLRKRIRFAWHVLRGWPLAFRLNAVAPVILNEEPGTWIMYCRVEEHREVTP